MDNNEEKERKPTTGVIGYIGMAFVVLALLGNILGFIKIFFEEGWSSASSKLPIGGLLVLGILGLSYLIAIPWLANHGYKSLAKAMAWVAAIVMGMLILSQLPSCGRSDTPAPTEFYYRR